LTSDKYKHIVVSYRKHYFHFEREATLKLKDLCKILVKKSTTQEFKLKNAQLSIENEGSKSYFGWKILFVSVVGMMFSPGPLVFGTLGVVLLPLQQEYNWGRAELMLSLTIFTLASILAAPFIGRLIDRFGVKKILIPSIVLMGLTLAVIPSSLHSLKLFYSIAFIAGVVSTGAQSIAYVRLLSSWFNQRLGFTIGIAASGLGLGYMVMPTLVQLILNIADWRSAYYMLAALVMLISLPLVSFVIRNEPAVPKTDVTTTTEKPILAGLLASEAIKTRNFWLMCTAITIMSMFLTGLLPHIVPLLKDRQITATMAATGASLMGLATFIGRIIVGYLLDRFFAPHIAIFFFSLAALGLGILIDASTMPLLLLAIFLLGLGFGAESDLIGYLVGRYFGLKSFAQIYGYVLAGFLLGAGIGPYLLGLSFNHWGSYQYILTIGCGMSIVSCVLFSLMSPYPDGKQYKNN
jgi:MFS family permease